MLLKEYIKCSGKCTEFWDLTLYEVRMVIEAGADKLEYELRLKTQFNFELAQNTAIAIMSRLEGKKPPTLQDTYPTLFGDINHIE